jgi:hypothetical protein
VNSSGEWKLQSPAAPSGTKAFGFTGIACPASGSCTAVGSYTNGSGVEVSLAEGWNGSKWVVQSTPNPTEAKTSALAGVACTSTKACTAVGTYTSGSSQPTPNEGKGDSLTSISCVWSTECYDVGSDTNSSASKVTLAQYYFG